MKIEPVKISIITVSYQAVDKIEKTILSVLNQSYPNIEYLVIDGGSIDGTVDIVKKYSDRLSYWISEPDKGLYDALNKGILKCTGEWIGILNCGDLFHDNEVVERLFSCKIPYNIGVIFGDCCVIKGTECLFVEAGGMSTDKNVPPDYRHGASFVRAEVQKRFLYDLSQKNKYKYALDYLQINTMYKSGVSFLQTSVIVLDYEEGGISDHRILNKYLRTLIENDGKKNLSFYKRFTRSIFESMIRHFKR